MTGSKGLLPKALNEKELGTLYAYCEAPLMLHHLLEKGETVADHDKALGEIHDVLAGQGPDDALLSLALGGLIVADRVHRLYEQDDDCRILATELSAEADQVVGYLGRLRIDLDSYRMQISDQDIFEYLSRVPDDLCVLASIYAELQDNIRPQERAPQDRTLSQALRILHYQAESQADLARSYIEGHMKPGNPAKPRPLDAIPLPPELQPQHDPAKIIEFSLFRR